MSLFLLLLFLGYPTPALATTTELIDVPYSSTTAPLLVRAIAVRDGADPDELEATIRCESNFDASARGDAGRSIGVAQINLRAHPEVTRAQALDPLWSIDWSAREFAAGDSHLWTCWRRLYGG